MTVVRELITVLGFQVDKAAYNKAAAQYDQLRGHITGTGKAAQTASTALGQAAKHTGEAAKQTSGLANALGMVQRFAATAGLSAMLRNFVTLASDANETTNALGALFGADSVAQIEEWSRAQGEAMGRSQYDLQAYAARLGSVLGPVTESREEALRMAQGMSQLAVDLGSFFNTSDAEAMQSLRSALTGEYESMKKYGVVLNDATLQEIAHKQGLKKKITQMTVAEKTALRYAAIMERTSAAQGDAARTGDGYANSMKAVQASLKDIGIGMAKKVVPVLETMIRGLRDGLKAFNQMTEGTNLLEAAFWTLAAVAAVLGAEFYAAFILPALGIAALVLLVDELITMFRGGKTVLGEFFNAFAGAGAAEEWVLNLAAGWSILNEEMSTAWSQFMSEWGNASAFDAVTGTWGEMLETWTDLLGGWVVALEDMILWPFRKAQEWLQSMGLKTGADIQEKSYTRTAGPGVGAREQTLAETRWQRYQERIARAQPGGGAGGTGLVVGTRGRQYAAGEGVGAGISAAAGIRSVAGGGPARPAPAPIDPHTAYMAAPYAPAPLVTSAAPATVTGDPHADYYSAALAAQAAGAALVSGPGAGQEPVVVQVATPAPTINIYGADQAAVRRTVAQALADERKAAIAALARQGGS